MPTTLSGILISLFSIISESIWSQSCFL